MEDYKIRVVQEFVDLSIKLERLEAFIRTDVFKALPPPEISMLNRQISAMRDYKGVLKERIAKF